MAPVRSGALAWSQAWWVDGLPTSSDSSFEDNLYTELPTPAATVDAVRLAVRDVLSRHENLRSRLDRSRPGRPGQLVDAVDDQFDAVVEVVPASAVEAARRTCFRIERQWPVKVLVFAEAGTVSGLGVLLDHWAGDGWSLGVLRSDLSQAVAARVAGRDWSGEGRAEQPIDVAEWEATPAAAAHLDRALRYWHDQLAPLEESLRGHRQVLAAGHPSPPGAHFQSCWMTSTTAMRAATAAAVRLGIPPSGLFLGAFGAAVARFEQAHHVGVFMLSANRLTAPARRAVRNAIMQAPVVLPAPEHAGFDEIATSAARQQAAGYRYANADPFAVERVNAGILGEVRHTGVANPRFNYINHNFIGDADGAAAMLARKLALAGDAPPGTVVFQPARIQGAKYMFSVNEVRDQAVMSLYWHTDTGWGAVAEPMLRFIEDFIARGADGPTGSTARQAPGFRPLG